MSAAGRLARRRDAREQGTHQTQKGSNHARQKNRMGAAINTVGGNTTRGETAHRETPPANTPPTASPLQEEGRSARLAEVGEDPRTSA